MLLPKLSKTLKEKSKMEDKNIMIEILRNERTKMREGKDDNGKTRKAGWIHYKISFGGQGGERSIISNISELLRGLWFAKTIG